MSDEDTSKSPPADIDALHDLCDAFEQEWQSGAQPDIWRYIRGWTEPHLTQLVRELVIIDIRYRQRNDLSVDGHGFLKRFPKHESTVRAVFVELGVGINSEHETDGAVHGDNRTQDCIAPPRQTHSVKGAPKIRRYEFRRLLGEGGFGRVYLAMDQQLQREVAIKIPRAGVDSTESVTAFLSEARVVASLSHPSIAPVFDVGQADDGHCYVVSQYIDGPNLSEKIKTDRASHVQSARLIAAVAEGLNAAHRKKLVHRDIKPANILLNREGAPFVTDFGLALRDEVYGKEGAFAGTPAYMSPEQARGEGHLVDGRSDLFSLGIVFFELLTGERPFSGPTVDEVLNRIKFVEARPPRQLDNSIPPELERICLKCISKRSSDRYTTAIDLANDLYVFLANEDERIAMRASESHAEDDGEQPIIPKGLRSFAAEDSNFFLQLLPGARDRGGIPESIRFWKNRIEETDPDESFRVGFIYGPSGCGKSSFINAGLLPQLAPHIAVCFVNCHSGQTETRLKRRLQQIAPDLSDDLEVDEAIAEIRTSPQLCRGQKVLIVLDQFEQWIHNHRRFQDQPLVRALRQCDANHVQCLALVRDDFWLAVHRLSQQLEINLSLDHNIAVVDLLDETHARNVLADFGRGYRRFPSAATPLTDDQEQFLDAAIEGLSQDGKIIPIHLAMFAEMTKDKTWSMEKLTNVGGVQGVGTAFLQSRFESPGTPPSHRLHRQAAQQVLRALLPDIATNIRGGMRSRDTLMQAAGYTDRPKDFDELMHVLDTDLRLLTPADIDDDAAASETANDPQAQSYQLTHDFLVPSVRAWLLQKQRQTRKGRAAILLQERAALWHSQKTPRSLPSFIELVSILAFMPRNQMTDRERLMRSTAMRYYGVRLAASVAFLVAMAGGLWMQRKHQTDQLVDQLRSADIGQVPVIVRQLERYPLLAKPLLRAMANDKTDVAAQLHARTAYSELFRLEAPFESQNLEHLTHLLKAENAESGDRFRAACLLARDSLDSNSEAGRLWKDHASFVADQQIAAITSAPSDVNLWTDALAAARTPLYEPLRTIYVSRQHTQAERKFSAAVLARYFQSDPTRLADLIQDAEPAQFEIMMSKLAKHRSASKLVQLRLDAAAGDERSNRVASCAVALYRLGDPHPLLTLLQRSDRPDVRTTGIFFATQTLNDFDQFSMLLDEQADPGTRQSILQILGSVPDKLSSNVKSRIATIAADILKNANDAGLHGTSAWLLRRWGLQERVNQIEDELAGGTPNAERRWYVTRNQRHTMVVLGSDTFLMGTPVDDYRRRPDEAPTEQRIAYQFAIGDKEVSIDQFDEYFRATKSTSYYDAYLAFERPHRTDQELELLAMSMRNYGGRPDGPRNFVDFGIIARYCNWVSKKEGLAPYYQIDQKARTISNGSSSNSGYRLPTSTEWEYACRARTSSARYFGDSDVLAERYLKHYAWYGNSSSDQPWPVGSLLPNDFGLFDMLGNVTELCNSDHVAEPVGTETDKDRRMARGSSFGHLIQHSRSAALFEKQNKVSPNLGFRLARTMPVAGANE